MKKLAIKKFLSTSLIAVDHRGWVLRLFLACLGIASTFALPPFHFVPVLLPTLAILVWLVDLQKKPWRVFLVLWWFGFGHFAFSNAWMANAILVRSEEFGWLYPIALIGPGAVLATAPALLLTILWRVGWPYGLARILLLTFAWCLAEWLRCWFLTGYPWNLIGYVWSTNLPILQSVSVIGVLGLGMLTFFSAAMPALFFDPRLNSHQMIIHRPSKWLIMSLVALLWAGIALYGGYRLTQFPTTYVTDVVLRLVQPAIPQEDKINPEYYSRNLQLYLSLTSQTPGFEKVTHVIWPESAVSYSLERYPQLQEVLAQVVPLKGKLIFGANRLLWEQDSVTQAWNSLYVLDDQGKIIAYYDKVHLVPFGEYVPLRPWLPWLNKITSGALDFSSGLDHVMMSLLGDKLPPFSPLICYEIIFPGQIKAAGQEPEWMLNITNDGWFGDSDGPYQHFAMARVRAVEEGIPLVRAAATGISGAVDPYGRIIGILPLNQQGVLDVRLPKPHPSPTLYARFGNNIFFGMLILLIFGIVLLRQRL